MTVYAVQEPRTYDKVKDRWLPRVNIHNASSFGEVTTLIPHDHVHAALVTQPTLHKLRRLLRDFSDEDYLLPVGDPVLIALAALTAAKENRGRVKFLRWSRERKEYDVVEAVV